MSDNGIYLNVLSRNHKIYERYIDENLVEHKRVVEDFKPSLFIESPAGDKYKTIFDVACVKKTYDNVKDFNQATYDKSMVKHGQDNVVFQYISDNYDEIDVQKYIKHIRVANVDIEVPAPKFPSPNQAEWEITSIAHYDSITNLHTVFVLEGKSQKWSKEHSILEQELLDRVTVNNYPDEKSVLIAYLDFFRGNYPAIFTGYNSDGFDIPYLYNRYLIVLGKTIANKLSPWGFVNKKQVIQWPQGASKTDELKADLIRKNKYFYDVTLLGIESLDWLALYKNFSFTPQASYKLDAIGESEIGQQKIHFKHNFMQMYGKQKITQEFTDENSHPYEYYAVMAFNATKRMTTGAITNAGKQFIKDCEANVLQYQDNGLALTNLLDCDITQVVVDYLESKVVHLAFQTITDYNVMDVELVNRLDTHRGFINLAITLSYYSKINFKQVFSPVATWDSIIFNSLKKQNIVIPYNQGAVKEQYIGGFVKAPIHGLKKNVVSFDYESLYPKLIEQANISPETFVYKEESPYTLIDNIERLLHDQKLFDTSEHGVTPNGCHYRKDKIGIIPIEINKVFLERKAWKRQMFIADKNAVHIKNELESRINS